MTTGRRGRPSRRSAGGAPRLSPEPRRPEELHAAFSVASATDPPVEMVGLRTEIKLWFDRPFEGYSERFLAAYEWLLHPIRERLRWYQTYTMKRFSTVRPQVLRAPHAWFAEGGGKEGRMLHLKGPGEKMAVGEYGLQFESLPDGHMHGDSNTPYLRVVMPARALADDPGGIFAIARQLGERLPFLSGYAGYVLETSPYFESQAFRMAYPLAMRHPGIHIAGDQATWALRDEKGLETVNWLTLVGVEPLRRLGGADAVRGALAEQPEIEVTDVAGGLIVQAGPAALLGDVDRGDSLPSYRRVYQALAAVIDPVVRDTRPLLLANDLGEERAMTLRWLRRFAS